MHDLPKKDEYWPAVQYVKEKERANIRLRMEAARLRTRLNRMLDKITNQVT